MFRWIGIIIFASMLSGAVYNYYHKWEAVVAEKATIEYQLKQQQALLEAKRVEAESLQVQISTLSALKEVNEKMLQQYNYQLDASEQTVLNTNEDKDASKLLKDAVVGLKNLRH